MIPRKWQLLIGVGGALLFAPERGLPADNSVQFSGFLEAVTHHTLSIRLEDGCIVDARIPEDGELSEQSMFGKYRMGDLVEIEGLPMKPAAGAAPRRDEETGLSTNLELRRVSFRRKPSPVELAVELGSGARLRSNLLAVPGQNDEHPVSLKTLELPAPPASLPDRKGSDARLEHTRALVHQYLAALPNFTADETLTIYRSPALATLKWTVWEALQSELRFQGSRESRQNIVRNGKPWLDSEQSLPAAARTRAPGLRLANIFDANCSVTIEYDKRAVEAGTPVLIYRFTSPPDSCFGANMDGGYRRYFAGHTGEVSVGEADGLVRRIDCSTTGFPEAFVGKASEERVTWDQVKIGEERHLLPVSAELLAVLRAGFSSLSVRKFTNHRHFEASSTVTFH